MPQRVSRFVRRVAQASGFDVYDAIYGEILLGNPTPIQQSSGAVYGIWVFSDEIPEGIESLPGHRNWYPVYWGKDIAPVSRMKAHVQGHRNGNINLPSRVFLRNKQIIYGAILVSNYQNFEQFLHGRYTPMFGTNRVGSRSTIIEIVN